MPASSPALTPHRIELLQSLEKPGNKSDAEPLVTLDDLHALSLLDLIRMDAQAQLHLTDKGRRLLVDRLH